MAMNVPFRGGFLLARASREMLTALPDGEQTFGYWAARHVGMYQLHFDPMFPCHEAGVGASGIVCLGYVCDVIDPDTPQRAIDRLARAWALSRDALNDRLTDCGGSFVLFAHRDGAVEVFLWPSYSDSIPLTLRTSGSITRLGCGSQDCSGEPGPITRRLSSTTAVASLRRSSRGRSRSPTRPP
jgi:hypothetical protein